MLDALASAIYMLHKEQRSRRKEQPAVLYTEPQHCLSEGCAMRTRLEDAISTLHILQSKFPRTFSLYSALSVQLI